MTKEKNHPVWTDSDGGIEVSIYRNGSPDQVGLYKESRKRYTKKAGEVISTTALTRGETAIANQLSSEGWRIVGAMIREERIRVLAAKKEAATTEATTVEPVSE